MRYKRFCVDGAIVLNFVFAAAFAQDSSPKTPEAPKTAPPGAAQKTEKPAAAAGVVDNSSKGQKFDRAALERDLEARLTNVLFKGSWRMTRRDEKTGATILTEPREESYEIESAHKAEDDWWVIKARVQFSMGGDKAADVTLPVRLRVVWAEDAAILTLDETTLPGLGTYGARVMIYRDCYSGVWFGKGYGGILSGQIVKADAAASQPVESKK